MAAKRIEVDHTPGGSPEPKSAPAPLRSTVTFNTFRRMSAADPKADREAVPVADLYRIALSAAQTHMKGRGYSTEDRADCAARCVLDAWKALRAAGGSSFYVNRHGVRTECVPAAYGSWTRFSNYAANLKRSLDAQRERDRLDNERKSDDQVHASMSSRLAAPGSDDPETVGTPYGARRAALTLLSELGLWDGARRIETVATPDRGEWAQGALWNRESGSPWHSPAPAVRASAPTGPLWTMAYSAVRSAVGCDAPEIARELDLSPATYRQHLTRARKLLTAAQHGERAYAMALAAPDLPGDYGRAAPLEDSERYRPDHEAPVRTRVDRRLKPRRTPADWTRDLEPRTRARLERLSEMRRERAAKKLADANGVESD